MDKIDESFSLATKLLFGHPITPWKRCANWLKARVPGGKSVPSCFGHGTAYVPEYGFFSKVPIDRVASDEDAQAASAKKMAAGKDESLSSIAANLKDFAYFVPTYAEGKNINVEDTFSYLDCQNICQGFDPFTSKNSACFFSIMDCDALFGAYRVIGASFSIHIYNSYYVQRCFEMDSAIKCTDCYFCHNVENLDNCMFCFNTKAKRYAIGNVEVGKEKYLQIKAQLLERIVPSLEKNGRLGFDICDVLSLRKES